MPWHSVSSLGPPSCLGQRLRIRQLADDLASQHRLQLEVRIVGDEGGRHRPPCAGRCEHAASVPRQRFHRQWHLGALATNSSSSGMRMGPNEEHCPTMRNRPAMSSCEAQAGSNARSRVANAGWVALRHRLAGSLWADALCVCRPTQAAQLHHFGKSRHCPQALRGVGVTARYGATLSA